MLKGNCPSLSLNCGMNAMNVNQGNNVKFLLQMLGLKLTGNRFIVCGKPAWANIIYQGILYKVIAPTVKGGSFFMTLRGRVWLGCFSENAYVTVE